MERLRKSGNVRRLKRKNQESKKIKKGQLRLESGNQKLKRSRGLERLKKLERMLVKVGKDGKVGKVGKFGKFGNFDETVEKVAKSKKISKG